MRFLPTEIFCLSYSGRSMPPYGRGLLHTIGELQGLKPLVMSCGNVAPKGATHKDCSGYWTVLRAAVCERRYFSFRRVLM